MGNLTSRTDSSKRLYAPLEAADFGKPIADGHAHGGSISAHKRDWYTLYPHGSGFSVDRCHIAGELYERIGAVPDSDDLCVGLMIIYCPESGDATRFTARRDCIVSEVPSLGFPRVACRYYFGVARGRPDETTFVVEHWESLISDTQKQILCNWTMDIVWSDVMPAQPIRYNSVVPPVIRRGTPSSDPPSSSERVIVAFHMFVEWGNSETRPYVCLASMPRGWHNGFWLNVFDVITPEGILRMKVHPALPIALYRAREGSGLLNALPVVAGTAEVVAMRGIRRSDPGGDKELHELVRVRITGAFRPARIGDPVLVVNGDKLETIRG